MSDQALAWKASFGALVLLFCAGTYLARNAPEASAPTAPALQYQSVEAASPDIPDDAPPVRIEVTLHETQPLPRLLAPMRPENRHKLRAPAYSLRPVKSPSPRIHTIAAKRKTSPYTVGRKHYPYDPRDLWAMRDSP